MGRLQFSEDKKVYFFYSSVQIFIISS